MKKITLVLLLTFNTFGTTTFVKNEISTRIKKELENIRISSEIDFYDGDIFSGLGSKISYKYQMEPSFISNKYLRFDEWRVLTEVRVGDILDEVSPVHLNIAKDSSIYFVRSFDSQLHAATARPYAINKIPHNSKTVLERMNTGDFFSFPSKLSLRAGLSVAPDIAKSISNAEIDAVVEGLFTISIYRLEDKLVRLKLVAQKQQGIQGKFETKIDYTVTGLSLLDRTLDNLLILDLLEVFTERAKGEQYILDYVFDLSNARAMEAFDQVLSPSKKFDLKEMIGKYRGIEYFKDKLISDYSLAEKLHAEENGVQRHFKGFNNYTFRKTGIKMGLLVSRFKAGKAYFKNNIVLEDKFGIVKKYFFPNRIHFYEEETNLKIIKRKDELETSFYGLVEIDSSTNSQGTIKGTDLDMGISHWRDDDFLNKYEWVKVKQEIYDILPIEIAKELNLNQFETDDTKTNSRVHFQIVFKDQALSHLSKVTFEEFYEQFKAIVSERVVFKKTFLGKIVATTVRVTSNIFGIKNISIKNFTRNIHDILSNDSINSRERIGRLLSLPDSFLFKRYAIKLFLSIIPRELWKDYVYINIEMHANNLEPVKYKYGELEMTEVFDQILQVNKQFYSPAHDLKTMINHE